MKGLFEWKILAAIFAVLIVSSSALISNSDMKSFFFNSTGSFSDWLGESPLSSLFATPEKGVNAVVITLSSDVIDLVMENPVNISMGDSSVDNFKGLLVLDFDSNMSTLIPDEGGMVLKFPIGNGGADNVKMTKVVFEKIDFVVNSEKTNLTATDDKIEIYDFIGRMDIDRKVTLTGNVSVVKDGQWSIG